MTERCELCRGRRPRDQPDSDRWRSDLFDRRSAARAGPGSRSRRCSRSPQAGRRVTFFAIGEAVARTDAGAAHRPRRTVSTAATRSGTTPRTHAAPPAGSTTPPSRTSMRRTSAVLAEVAGRPVECWRDAVLPLGRARAHRRRRRPRGPRGVRSPLMPGGLGTIPRRGDRLAGSSPTWRHGRHRSCSHDWPLPRTEPPRALVADARGRRSAPSALILEEMLGGEACARSRSIRAARRSSRPAHVAARSPASASQAFATRFCARVSHASATRSRNSSWSTCFEVGDPHQHGGVPVPVRRREEDAALVARASTSFSPDVRDPEHEHVGEPLAGLRVDRVGPPRSGGSRRTCRGRE